MSDSGRRYCRSAPLAGWGYRRWDSAFRRPVRTGHKIWHGRRWHDGRPDTAQISSCGREAWPIIDPNGSEKQTFLALGLPYSSCAISAVHKKRPLSTHCHWCRITTAYPLYILCPTNPLTLSSSDNHGRSYWIPGSWHMRMVYTDGIPFHDPSQESNRAGQHHESHRRGAVLSDGS
jgi:hypothetical protein